MRNNYKILNGYIFVETSSGGGFLIDKASMPRIAMYKWSCNAAGYICSKLYGKSFYLHRLLTSCPDGDVVDHINRDPKDNRLENLRVCNYSQNLVNSGVPKAKRSNLPASKYKGVSYHLSTGKWRARITVENKGIHLGLFQNEIEAALSYNKAAIQHFGEFANLNIVTGGCDNAW